LYLIVMSILLLCSWISCHRMNINTCSV
jgi:hypothetical protein